MLTHLPYHPWCSACVEGRRRDDLLHRRRAHKDDDVLPVISFDYGFSRDETGSRSSRDLFRLRIRNWGPSCQVRHGHLFWREVCSHDDAETTRRLLCCQSMHRVRAFAWVRKHGFASGWRAGHARNEGNPSRDEKWFAPTDRPHLTSKQSHIQWSCRRYSSANSRLIPHTSDPARITFRTARFVRTLSCCLVDPSRRLATRAFCCWTRPAHNFGTTTVTQLSRPLSGTWRERASEPSRH